MKALEDGVEFSALVAVRVLLKVHLVVMAESTFIVISLACILVGEGEVNGERLLGEGFDGLELGSSVSCFFVDIAFLVGDSGEDLVEERVLLLEFVDEFQGFSVELFRGRDDFGFLCRFFLCDAVGRRGW